MISCPNPHCEFAAEHRIEHKILRYALSSRPRVFSSCLLCRLCPDFGLNMPVMEGLCPWLSTRTVRLLQGCVRDMQLCCSQVRFASEIIQLVLACTEQGGTWL